VTKIFGDRRVVDEVSFDIRPGSIVALLGENGAGKSTLIKMLAGVYPRDGGEILFEGSDVDHGRREGIAFIHQDLGLLEWMTVAENMAMGLGFARRGRLIDWRGVQRRAAEALDLIGGGIDPRDRVFDLTRADKSLLAIARALAVDCRVLVLDEPTASLPEADVARLFEVMNNLRDQGVAMIFVSHRLDEVFRIADEVVVMRDGVLVGHGPVAETTPEELVVQIVGHEPTSTTTITVTPGAEAIAELDGLTVGDVGPVDLRVDAGELVALVGLRGAGQRVIGRALCGLETATGGQFRLRGNGVSFASPRSAIGAGVAFVTSNREAESMAVSLSVRENLFLNPATRGRGWNDVVARRTERAQALPVIRKFGVRPLDTEREIATLSGGNQQKVILARWLDIGAHLLVLEEPTMGVDVGAKAEIYALLGEALEAGAAVVIVSTDLEEVANVASRAFVFSRGRVTAELTDADLTMANLILHASASDHQVPA
jgi:ribose transport system ATP-binding protein